MADAKNTGKEVEITPEMIEEGIDALLSITGGKPHDDTVSPDEIIKTVFAAMEAARQRPKVEEPPPRRSSGPHSFKRGDYVALKKSPNSRPFIVPFPDLQPDGCLLVKYADHATFTSIHPDDLILSSYDWKDGPPLEPLLGASR